MDPSASPPTTNGLLLLEVRNTSCTSKLTANANVSFSIVVLNSSPPFGSSVQSSPQQPGSEIVIVSVCVEDVGIICIVPVTIKPPVPAPPLETGLIQTSCHSILA
ncbi:MAG: Uncharacterised protein [Methanobacteriota archaeon]|nr:MAG: Uncharacterised protein [Euryarchaeota archaeon]